MTTHCAPGLQPGPPSQTPGGSGPEVLNGERGHVTSESGVSEVGSSGPSSLMAVRLSWSQ